MLILALAVFWFHRMSCRKEIFNFFFPSQHFLPFIPLGFPGMDPFGRNSPLVWENKDSSHQSFAFLNLSHFPSLPTLLKGKIL